MPVIFVRFFRTHDSETENGGAPFSALVPSAIAVFQHLRDPLKVSSVDNISTSNSSVPEANHENSPRIPGYLIDAAFYYNRNITKLLSELKRGFSAECTSSLKYFCRNVYTTECSSSS